MASGADMTLRGFVGDYRGGKFALTAFRPAFEADGALFVAQSLDWTTDSIQELSQNDFTTYVHQFSGGAITQERHLREGDLVWLAGQIFVNRCADLEAFGNKLKVWPSFTPDYKFSIGTFDRFTELNRGIFSAAVRGMHRALFDRRDCSSGRASRLFDVLNNIHVAPSRAQQLERGLYYREMFDEARLEAVRVDALTDGLFVDNAEFNEALDRLHDELSKRKLRDIEFESAQSPDHRQELDVAMEFRPYLTRLSPESFNLLLRHINVFITEGQVSKNLGFHEARRPVTREAQT